MPTALVFNPGSNSLKFELVQCEEGQKLASRGKKLASASIDDIGRRPRLTSETTDLSDVRTGIAASDMHEAATEALHWLRKDEATSYALEALSYVALRVVHGGTKYKRAVRATKQVRSDILRFENLAPLHNKSSLDILDALRDDQLRVPVFVCFDTSFHQTLPEIAWRYPIERRTEKRYGVRKFGFHGLSHRYMLEQFAEVSGKKIDKLNLVTMHLESGCSACAIMGGKSVDTTMGMTPLEGLMMGTRSGSIDPAVFPHLVRKSNKSAEDILSLLNKESGLLGVAGKSLDTRELVKRKDQNAKLALAMRTLLLLAPPMPYCSVEE